MRTSRKRGSGLILEVISYLDAPKPYTGLPRLQMWLAGWQSGALEWDKHNPGWAGWEVILLVYGRAGQEALRSLGAGSLRQQSQFLLMIHGLPGDKFLGKHIHSVEES